MLATFIRETGASNGLRPYPPTLRLQGAALAYLAEEVLLLFVTIVMMVWLHRHQAKEEKTWRGFSTEALKGWWAYLNVCWISYPML